MAEDWVSVRVPRRTWERLRDRLKRLENAWVQGNPGVREGIPLSLGAVIERLLDHVDNDDRRKLESRKRRAAARISRRHHIITSQEIGL